MRAICFDTNINQKDVFNSQLKQESASDQGLAENLLNLKACRDVVKNESLSSSEKHDILQKKTFMCFSFLNPLTVWLLGTVLYIAYASFIW